MNPPMKKIMLIATSLVFLFGGCDYVEVPTQAGGSNNGNGNGGVTRRVLLEEFTGHICIACPTGAAVIEQMEDLYGDRLVTIAVHHGFFANPCPPSPLPNNAPDSSFLENFTTGTNSGEGYEYELNYPDVFGTLPSGLVNRAGVPSGSYAKSHGSWPSVVDSVMQLPAVADLEFDTVIYNTSSRALNFSVRGEFLSSQNGTFNIVVMLTEDSLIGWQTDGSTYIPDYVFKHVLRACVNTPGSIVGTSVATGSIAPGSDFTFELPAAYTVNANWNAGHCHLIAFIYNTNTKEVLQAAEADLQ